MKTTGSRKGLTIIENILVIVLSLILITGSFNLYPLVLKFFARQEGRLMADNYAYSQIEDLRVIARTSGLGVPALDSGNGKNPTENILPPTGFTIKYDVADMTRPDTPTLVGTSPDFKRVTVRCTHTASNFTATLIADVIS